MEIFLLILIVTQGAVLAIMLRAMSDTWKRIGELGAALNGQRDRITSVEAAIAPLFLKQQLKRATEQLESVVKKNKEDVS